MLAHVERWLARVRHWWHRRWFPGPVSAHWIDEHTREDR